MMARDYISIPASSCLSEHSFSVSGCTDLDPTRQRMDADRFAGLQRSKAAYQDGWLSSTEEAWMKIEPNFDFDSPTESENEFRVSIYRTRCFQSDLGW